MGFCAKFDADELLIDVNENGVRKANLDAFMDSEEAEEEAYKQFRQRMRMNWQ